MNFWLLVAILVVVLAHFAWDLGLLGRLWRWLRLDVRPGVRIRKRVKKIRNQRQRGL